jgi:hypothetical protein
LTPIIAMSFSWRRSPDVVVELAVANLSALKLA